MSTNDKLEDALRAIRDTARCEGLKLSAAWVASTADEALANHAASLAAPPAQREWVLVPREPTEAMIEAGFRWHGLAAYKAMIAAAPDAPALESYRARLMAKTVPND